MMSLRLHFFFFYNLKKIFRKLGCFWWFKTRLDDLACWIRRSRARQSHRSCCRHCCWLQKSDAFLAAKSRRFRSCSSWLFCRSNYRKYRSSKFRWLRRSNYLQKPTWKYGQTGDSSNDGLFFSNHRYVGVFRPITGREIFETFAEFWTLDGAERHFDATLDFDF